MGSVLRDQFRVAEERVVYGEATALLADILYLVEHSTTDVARVIYALGAEFAGKWQCLFSRVA